MKFAVITTIFLASSFCLNDQIIAETELSITLHKLPNKDLAIRNANDAKTSVEVYETSKDNVKIKNKRINELTNLGVTGKHTVPVPDSLFYGQQYMSVNIVFKVTDRGVSETTNEVFGLVLEKGITNSFHFVVPNPKPATDESTCDNRRGSPAVNLLRRSGIFRSR